MWTRTRITIYTTAALAGLAFILSQFGLVDYDVATGMVDPRPFNINWLAAIIAAPMASGMAGVVLWWQGRK